MARLYTCYSSQNNFSPTSKNKLARIGLKSFINCSNTLILIFTVFSTLIYTFALGLLSIYMDINL